MKKETIEALIANYIYTHGCKIECEGQFSQDCQEEVEDVELARSYFSRPIPQSRSRTIE